MFDGFTDQRIEVSNSIKLRVRSGGSGPPVLLLHGYPQTHVCWHKVAPRLIDAGFTVVISDLRGYGDSDKPVSCENHETYSKRAMALDQVELMAQLGFKRFGLVGHDRGARVAHRLAQDHPDVVERLAVLDIVPTATMYALTNQEFATGYYHWFFLIQPSPLPEKLIGSDPAFYLRSKLNAWSKGNSEAFTEAAVSEYVRCFNDPACIAATCEDYRAAVSIDLVHDDEGAETKLEMPVLALWGDKGLVGKLYDVVEIWQEQAINVAGKALTAGHFLPEEVPKETANALIAFLRGK